jgi:flagellar hook-associated protein 1 FlgK
MPSRQAMLSGAQTLVARFQSLDQRLSEIGSGINGALQSSVGAINSFAQQIAALNNNISIAEAATNMQPANDLRDQRDTLIAELGKEIRVSTAIQSDGSYNVFVGNGQPVVVGRQTFDLVAAPSLEDVSRLEVGYRSGAKVVLLGSSTLQGGNLGGLLAFRSETLDSTRNAIGRVAIGVARTFNDQHKLGQDLSGAIGVDFFKVASPAVLPRTGNAGNAAVSASITDASALTTSDYRLNYTSLAGGNSTFSLTRVSDGTSTNFTFAEAAGGSVTVDGVTVTIPASPPGAAAVVNDSWLIEPTRVGALDIAVALKDPSKIAAASPVRTGAATANSGSASISSASVSAIAVLPTAGTPITLTYDALASQFVVTPLALALAPIPYVSGASISINGIKFSISGAPQNSDVFTIDRNVGGVSDSSNAVTLAGLQSAKSLGKNASVAGAEAVLNFQQAYAQLVSDVGNKARQTEVMATAQKNLIAQTEKAQQSIAGVNLDDEAANLLRYQQAYQASGKMMQIATSLFQTLLDISR